MIRDARERLAPILMTALTTRLALVPFLITGNASGQEIEYPMTIVILGGLVTSTVLNLFVARRSTCGSLAPPPRPRTEKRR